jgi:hypothetical protein
MDVRLFSRHVTSSDGRFVCSHIMSRVEINVSAALTSCHEFRWTFRLLSRHVTSSDGRFGCSHVISRFQTKVSQGCERTKKKNQESGFGYCPQTVSPLRIDKSMGRVNNILRCSQLGPLCKTGNRRRNQVCACFEFIDFCACVWLILTLVVRLWGVKSEVRILAEAGDFSPLRNIKTPLNATERH